MRGIDETGSCKGQGTPTSTAGAAPIPAWGALKTADWRSHSVTAVALLLLAGLWSYKARDLVLPYFWDELGVYARAAVYMFDHGLSLLPSALPPDLSRGHPPLLAFVVALVFRVFGAAPVVAHSFMLLVSSALLGSVFAIGRSHGNRWPGAVAAGLLLAQPLFLAQSTLVLPEIPMALACLWSMHAFALGKHRRAALFVGLAIFLKESAVVLEAVLLMMLAARRTRSRRLDKDRVKAALALMLPGALYGAFLLVQKHQNGWYLYPFHSEQVNFHWSALKVTLVDGMTFLFAEQGRLGLSVVTGLWLLLLLLGRDRRAQDDGARVAWMFVAFILAFLLFSAGNVFMKRYLLCLLPPLVILSGRALFELSQQQGRVALPATVALALLCLSEIRSARFNCAYDMSFRESVLLQQEATRYLEKTVGTDRAVLANFPTVFGLEDSRYGYATRKFARSSYEPSAQDQFIFASELYGQFEPPKGIRTELMRRFASPYMNIALYRVVR